MSLVIAASSKRFAKMLAERVDQRGLARADRAADPDPERVFSGLGHERNRRVYWVSWAIEKRSIAGAALPRSSSPLASRSPRARRTVPSSAAVRRWPSVWPSGIKRMPAEIRLAAKACRNAPERSLERQVVGARGDAEHDRVRRLELRLPAEILERVERGCRPGLAQHGEQRAALRRALERELAGAALCGGGRQDLGQRPGLERAVEAGLEGSRAGTARRSSRCRAGAPVSI